MTQKQCLVFLIEGTEDIDSSFLVWPAEDVQDWRVSDDGSAQVFIKSTDPDGTIGFIQAFQASRGVLFGMIVDDDKLHGIRKGLARTDSKPAPFGYVRSQVGRVDG